MLKKICGLYLFAVAVLVAAHTVVEPLYHASGPGQSYSPFWAIVNPLTALAIVLGAVFSYTRKREARRLLVSSWRPIRCFTDSCS